MRYTGWLILLGVAAALMYMTAPNPRRSRMKRWRRAAFAHRGLHDLRRGVVENTLEAFDAACAAGFGMELDVQFSRDFEIVVFHDDTLRRMTGDPRRVDACTVEALRSLDLAGVRGAHIPTLREVLERVDGRTPLLIEIKNGRHNARLCRDLMAMLEGYRGEYIVESFNPLIVAWFRFHAPRVVRGQLVCPMEEYIPAASRVSAAVMAGLMLNCVSRPDFVAYNVNAPRLFSHHFQRALFHTPMAAWTVHTDDMWRLVEKRGEMAIFERTGDRGQGTGVTGG